MVAMVRGHGHMSLRILVLVGGNSSRGIPQRTNDSPLEKMELAALEETRLLGFRMLFVTVYSGGAESQKCFPDFFFFFYKPS